MKSGSQCSYLVIAIPVFISRVPVTGHKEGGAGPTGVEVGDGGGVAEGHRAVEVIFFIPLRWARVEQPTGSRIGGTFLLRAE